MNEQASEPVSARANRAKSKWADVRAKGVRGWAGSRLISYNQDLFQIIMFSFSPPTLGKMVDSVLSAIEVRLGTEPLPLASWRIHERKGNSIRRCANRRVTRASATWRRLYGTERDQRDKHLRLMRIDTGDEVGIEIRYGKAVRKILSRLFEDTKCETCILNFFGDQRVKAPRGFIFSFNS